MLNCLGSRARSFQKGEYIFLSGQSKPYVGILLSGRAQIVRENIFGDTMIIGRLQKEELFGEIYACMGEEVMPVSVVALENCDVLLLDVGRMVHVCKSACPFHQQLIANLLRIIAKKCAMINRKMSYLTHKTIRGRLEAYFYDLMELRGSYEFTLLFNKQELADYLCVDRSAMSRELSNMKRDGMIDYNGRNIKWMNQ